MAIGNSNDLTHIVRTSDQWKNTYDKYELIPVGVLCVELVSSDVTKIKIGDGHNIFSKLPYIGDLDLSKYYTKLETDTRIKEILTQEKVVRIKGIIGSKSDLPADARCGDIYFVRQLSSSDNKYIEYIYSPDNTWEPLGGIPVDIDLSEYAKTAYVDDKIEQVNERIDDIEQHGTHTHSNKEILDQITEPYTTADKETLASLHNYDDTEIREMISQSSHTHSNKDILDATSAAFTREDKSKLDQLNPYDDSTIKERITELERVAHEHSNKRILDRTTASFTTEYERKMRWIRMYTGCTGMEEGIAGLVPAAQAGEEDYVLSGSGEWVPQTGGGGTYELPIATTSTLGGIKVGDGLEIDENGVLSTTGGGGGGDSIAEGDGITIITDPQTGVKTISVNTGDHLEVDENTGELNVTDVDYTAGQGIHIGADYTLIEYIKNSGNYDQIILTDIIPASTNKLEMDIKFGAATGNTTNDIFIGCSRLDTSEPEYMYAIYLACDSNNYASLAFYNHFKWTSTLPSNNFIQRPAGISYNGSGAERKILTLQGFTASWGNQSAEFSVCNAPDFTEPQHGLVIFGSVSRSGNVSQFDCQELTVYGIKLYDSNNTLLHDLRPVERGTDGEAGLYDLVTHKFYGNAGNGSFVKGPPVSSVDDRLISAKIGNGLQFDSNDAIEVNTGDGLSINQNNELEVNVGNGLQFNQDGELEIDPSIIPEVPEYRAGEAINIESITRTLEPTTFSNIDYIASFSGAYNGRIEKNTDGTEFTITASRSDAYTEDNIGHESNGSYPYNVESSTKYRLTWDATGDIDAGGIIIFENGGYNIMHNDYASAEYIEFTTSANTTFFTMRCGVLNNGQSITFSNFNLYRVLEEALEYDEISVKYNNGLTVNQDNELEVNVGNGLSINNNGEVSVNIGTGLEIDPQTGAINVTGGSGGETYEAGDGIEITEVTHEDEFRVLNQEYFFDTRGLTCGLNARIWTTVNDGDILAAMCIHNSGGNQVPLFVGLTEDSVKVSQNYDSTILGPNGSFDYLGKTWYFTADYALSGTDGQDTQGHIQTLPTTYSFNSTPSNFVPAAKDLIDLAVLLPDVSIPTISAKIGAGLSFDANGAIQADAQPLSPATDSTLGGVIVGDGILVDDDGTISVDPTIIPEVPTYEAGTAILVVDNSNPYINKVRWTISDIRGTSDSWIQMRYFGFYNENQERLAIQSGLGEWSDDSTVTYYQHRTLSAMINNQYEMTASLWDGTKSFILTFNLPVGTRLNDLKYFRYQTGDDETHRDPVSWKIHAYSEELDVWLLLNTETNATIPTGRDTWTDYFDLEYVPTKTIDAWNSGTGWDNFAYTSGDSDSTSGWNRCVHSPVSSINTLFPVLSTKIKVIARDQNDGLLSVRIELHTSAGRHYGCYEYSQDEEIIDLKEFCELHSVDVPAYVSLGLCTLVNPNYANISPSNVSRVDIIWYTDIVSPTKDINVKYGNGLTVNQNNELEVELSPATETDLGGIKIGSGFTYLIDGTLNANPAMSPFEVGDALELLYDDPDALPTGYAHVDYVSSNPATNSTSSTNYGRARTLIDYTPENVTKLEIKMARDNEYQDSCFVGCRTSGSANQFVFWHENRSSQTQIAFAYGSTGYDNARANVSYVTGQVQEIEASIPPAGTSGNINVLVNGNVVKTYAKSGSPLAYKLGIFQSNRANEWEYQISNGRIYYLRLYEGNTLAVNLIPAVRLADEVVGFYDNVNDKFYTSSTDYPFTTDMSTIVIDGAHRTLNVKYNNGLMLNQNNELEVNLGSGLQFDANGAIEVTGGGSSGGNGDYTAGDAIEFRSTQLSLNVDAIRWDISNIKSTSQTSGPWTQVRYIEFCDDSGTPYTISSASGIWEDNTSITYSTTAGSQTINDMIANTQKMCAIWRYPNHTMQLTFNLDTAVPCADIAKFRIKLGDDVPDRDPKSWKVYFRDAATQIWYIVQDITDAELSDTRNIWSNYYPFDITGATSINVKYGTGLTIDPITGELFVDGQLPEGTIIKKLTYVGTGAASIDIQFTKKPIAILNIYGDGLDGNKVSTTSAPIDSPALNMTYGKGTSGAGVVSCNMSYNDTTNVLTLSGGVDEGARCNKSGSTYTMYYLTKGHTGSGTSVNNEVSVVKTFSYVGTGTTVNNIQFPETPDMILKISGPLVTGDITTAPIEINHPTTNADYMTIYTQHNGGSNTTNVSYGTFSFNDSTNVLTLTGGDYGDALNYSGGTYYVQYIVNEVISNNEVYEYIAGEGILIKDYSDILPEGYTAVKALKSTGNQYIDTGYIIKANTSFEMQCKIYETSRGWVFPLGTRNSSNAMMFCTEHWGSGSSIEYWLQDGDATATSTERSVFYNEPVVITINDNVLTCVNQTTHGTVTLTVTGKTMPSDIPYPLYIFATNDTGSVAFYGDMDLYSFKILESGTVVHEYIPCLNNNNVAGLYDIYTDTFKTSPNGNTFFHISGTPTGEEAIKKVQLKKATTSTLGGVIVGDGLSVDSNGELEVNLGSGLSFDANGAIQVTGGGGGGGDTVAQGDGISITTDQQTGNKVIAVNVGSGLQINQTTQELEATGVSSISATPNTPGSITITNGSTSTPLSVISQMGGAGASTAGSSGYVPAPASGDNDAYLRGDGVWDDDVLTENDSFTITFVPDDYQPT